MDFKEMKSEINDIITSKTAVQKSDTIPASDDQFTFDNGIKTWVTAIFVDIRNSTSLFKNNDDEKTARIIRAFSQGIIEILSDDENCREIGIRGDCVYGAYSTPKKQDDVKVFDHAKEINSFLMLLNSVLKNNSFPTFKAGIGIGDSMTLVIKAGKKGAGINDKVWIGDSVVDASNFSGVANKLVDGTIAMDDTFYENTIEILKKRNPNYANWIQYDSTQKCYYCSVYDPDVNEYL
jgi:class 3 adenylate cyclase